MLHHRAAPPPHLLRLLLVHRLHEHALVLEHVTLDLGAGARGRRRGAAAGGPARWRRRRRRAGAWHAALVPVAALPTAGPRRLPPHHPRRPSISPSCPLSPPPRTFMYSSWYRWRSIFLPSRYLRSRRRSTRRRRIHSSLVGRRASRVPRRLPAGRARQEGAARSARCRAAAHSPAKGAAAAAAPPPRRRRGLWATATAAAPGGRAPRPLPLTIAGVAALGLGLRREPRARARVDDLRLADDQAVLDQLAHVLACGGREGEVRAGRVGGGGRRRQRRGRRRRARGGGARDTASPPALGPRAPRPACPCPNRPLHWRRAGEGAQSQRWAPAIWAAPAPQRQPGVARGRCGPICGPAAAAGAGRATPPAPSGARPPRPGPAPSPPLAAGMTGTPTHGSWRARCR
jgi:hypothetical protein